MHDVIVLGAGVSGLQCARRLKSAGADVLLVDRADKPGGRCATRVFEGQPADYGPLFVHGSDPAFLAAVDAAGGKRLQGLGVKVTGRIPLVMPTNKYNEFYLKTKMEKSGHLLEQIDRPVLEGMTPEQAEIIQD